METMRTRPRPGARALPGLVVVPGLLGCAGLGSPEPLYPLETDPFEALVRQSPVGIAPDADVLALDPEVTAWRHESFGPGISPLPATLGRLTEALAEGGAIGIRYDSLAVHGASATFHRGEGNCLSQTHLLVALSRALGMTATYREVWQAPDWLEMGEVRLQNRHVVARVHIPEHGDWEVDLGRAFELPSSLGRSISDRHARALHFNNLGVASFARGAVDEALRAFARALLLEPDLAHGWANLGTAWLRKGDLGRAEAALLRAIALDSSGVIAMNALARLYRRAGEEDRARMMLARAETARRKNPFLQYAKGRAHLAGGRAEAALPLLEAAAEGLPGLARVHAALGHAYLEVGRDVDARNAFQTAEHLAVTPDERAELRRMLLHVRAELAKADDRTAGRR